MDSDPPLSRASRRDFIIAFLGGRVTESAHTGKDDKVFWAHESMAVWPGLPSGLVCCEPRRSPGA